ncbi:hypothetical protein D3C81_1144280 [compost metagenome]
MLQGLGGHVGVAVAVATDPRAHLQERRQRCRLCTRGALALARGREHRGDVFFQLRHQLRDAAQEAGAVVRQRVVDLVAHRQARVAQHAGLPQRGDLGAQLGGVVLALARGGRQVALSQQAGDLALGVQDALALDFGRVRGQHRHDQRLVQELAQLLAGDAGGIDLFQRVLQAAGLRRRAGQRMHAAAAVVVLVLGDIGQVREIAERAHHLVGLVARQALEQAVQLGAGGAVVLAAEAHGGLANRLNQIERGLAFLLAHAVAQQAAQEADVLAQRQVLVGGTARGRGHGGDGRIGDRRAIGGHHGQLGTGGARLRRGGGSAFRFTRNGV